MGGDRSKPVHVVQGGRAQAWRINDQRIGAMGGVRRCRIQPWIERIDVESLIGVLQDEILRADLVLSLPGIEQFCRVQYCGCWRCGCSSAVGVGATGVGVAVGAAWQETNSKETNSNPSERFNNFGDLMTTLLSALKAHTALC